jgi:hypothetical protein
MTSKTTIYPVSKPQNRVAKGSPPELLRRAICVSLLTVDQQNPAP